MAVNATTVWEFQSGGADTNGGGFDAGIAGGVDYSTSTTAQATLTTASVVGATTTDIMVFATDYTVATTDVGNVMYLTGGSATTGFYQIQSVVTGAGQYWRMDRAVGTAGQTCPGKMGGCRKLVSSNSFPAALVAGNKVYVKNGSYTIAAYTGQTAGTTAAPIICEGYNSTRGDLPTGSSRPTLAVGSSAFTIGTFTIFRNIIFTTSNASGISIGADSRLEYSKATSTNATSTNGAILAGANRAFVYVCEAINASGRGIILSGSGSFAYGSTAHGCDTGIVHSAASSTTLNCISYSNTTAAFLINASTGGRVINNTFYGAETPAGIGISGTAGNGFFLNNIIYGFVTGISFDANYPLNFFNYNNLFNNTTARSNATAGTNDIALDPQFVAAGTGNFAVGTNMKAAGFPGTFGADISTTIGYTDIGAVQRQESSSGGGFFGGE